MAATIIGRKEEQKILQTAYESHESELVSVIGRRRVGKTFLIKSYFQKEIVFEITGVQKAPKSEQLRLFTEKLNEVSQNQLPIPPLKDWHQAFNMLRAFLEKSKGDKKQVVFIDEFPWLAANRPEFLRAFGYFWNSWANWENMLVIICGSAASWMIKNVVNNTGGMYNRITKRIFLQPFNLAETETFLKSRKVNFPRYQIAQIYMTTGGIPHYLKEIVPERSAVQNINYLCFSQNGILRDEFQQLYHALFTKADNHIAVIRALASKKKGLTRKEIVEISQLPNGGGLTKVLQELEQSSFISIFYPFGKKKKEKLFRLTDEYSLFYLKFIENSKNEDPDVWNLLSQTQIYKTWSGYAFENLCMKHIPQIKKALGISGVFSQSYSFFKKGTEEEQGAQIDLLIDRKDQVINLCEIKFHSEEFIISKEYAGRLRTKRGVFRRQTKTKKHLMLTMITTFGVVPNMYSLDLIPISVTLDDLFEKIG